MLKFRYLTYSNFGLIKEWYEEMAKDGWQIEKIPLPFLHKFKKAEPEEIKYRISLARNEGAFSAFTKEELDEFDEMSDDLGWHLIDRSFNMNLYRLEDGAADSLYNDDIEEIKVLNKGLNGELIVLIMSFLIFLFNFSFISATFYSSDIFYENFILFLYPGSILLLIFILLSIIDFISFKIKNKNTEKASDIKFSKISYSKFYVVAIVLSLLFIFVGTLLNLFSTILNRGFKATLPALVPILVSLIIFFTIKNIKRMETKTSNKKKIMAILFISIFVIINLIGPYLIFSIPPDFDEADIYEVRELPKSILTESHTNYKLEDLGIEIEKTVVKNSDLGKILFEREIVNAKNHPYKSENVRDITSEFPFEKTYSLAYENTYLILNDKTVFKVNGDINNEKIMKELKKLMGV